MLRPATAAGSGRHRRGRPGDRQQRQRLDLRTGIRTRRQTQSIGTHLRSRRTDELFRRVLDRRPHPLVPESTGRVQLPLQLLHDSAGARRQPQPPDRRSRGRSAANRRARSTRNRTDGYQHRRFRPNDRRTVHRPVAGPRPGRRHRSLPHFVDRAEPADRRGHRFHSGFETIPVAFSHSDPERKRPHPGADAPPVQHGTVRGPDR